MAFFSFCIKNTLLQLHFRNDLLLMLFVTHSMQSFVVLFLQKLVFAKLTSNTLFFNLAIAI